MPDQAKPVVVEGYGSLSYARKLISSCTRSLVYSQKEILETEPAKMLLSGMDHRVEVLPTQAANLDTIRHAHALIEGSRPNLIVALGGGSVIDATKLARASSQRKCRLLAIPTTAGTGAEFSPAAVFYRSGRSEALVDPSLRPDVVVKDPILLASVPLHVRVAAGCDAFFHTLESAINCRSSSQDVDEGRSVLHVYLEQLPSYVQGCNQRASLEAISQAVTRGAKSFVGCGAFHALAVPLTEAGLPHGCAVAMAACVALEVFPELAIQCTEILKGLVVNRDDQHALVRAMQNFDLHNTVLNTRHLHGYSTVAFAARSSEATRLWENTGINPTSKQLVDFYERFGESWH